MTTEKLAISIPADLLARARSSAKRAPSLSVHISSALEQKPTMDDLARLLEGMLAESGGPLTAKEGRAADRVLLRSPRRRRNT